MSFGKIGDMIKSFFRKNRPFLIAGPCSVENRDQLISTAQLLKDFGKVDLLRGGIWKPRTRPGAFEGIGEVGLDWMIEARQLTGLPLAVEVAKTEHVEISLKKGIDVLWIGARTTVNPFAVQEIAESLIGVDIPVMVKNPVNPDIALWFGAVERLQKVGIKDIAAIHRGFYFYGEKIYRNRPQWQIALDFKEAMPDFPLITDPSHICGKRSNLKNVAQKALDLNFDGLMIESHYQPDIALSDAAQQVTPADYSQLIESLTIRNNPVDAENISPELDKLRDQIDILDDEIINLLSSRMDIARSIGKVKNHKNLTILQRERWAEIYNKYLRRATELGISEDFINQIIKAIHLESIEQQEKIMSENKLDTRYPE
ncbi:MAG TPA: chorismate mutase [Saprospiraceae bacterium]|nr:chorismate mutase [Saprospiraceae bacterium]